MSSFFFLNSRNIKPQNKKKEKKILDIFLKIFEHFFDTNTKGRKKKKKETVT